MVEEIKSLWAVDFEYWLENFQPVPLCCVMKNINTGEEIRLWKEELNQLCPVKFDEHTALVAYYAAAELKCFSVLNWPIPTNILDAYVRYRADMSGFIPEEGQKLNFNLLGCQENYGLKAGIGYEEKEEMRQLALRGGDYTAQEKKDLLDYCSSDVQALYQLLTNPNSSFRFEPVDLERGQFMIDVAKIEMKGIPIDTELYGLFEKYADQICAYLKQQVNEVMPVYDAEGSFNNKALAWYLNKNNIEWKYKKGRPILDQNYLKNRAAKYEIIEFFYKKRKLIDFFKRLSLKIGSDGYSRFMASPFSSKTGRSQPSSSENIFGQPAVLRRLIKPKPGKALAYVDYCQQEFAIAAVLSQDPNMIESYLSGDPYLYFGKLAGVIPLDGTKETHPNERKVFKECILGVQYGMEAYSLQTRIKGSKAKSKQILQYHQDLYSVFRAWSHSKENEGLLKGELKTFKGWPIHVFNLDKINPNTLRNFLMQATGADILRETCRLYRNSGYDICTTVHDAILIEADDDKIEDAVAKLQNAMAKGSANILGGFELRSDAKIIRYPDCYIDERDDGKVFGEIMDIIAKLKKEQGDE